MGYDEWLQEPYQEECRAQEEWERAEEDFRDSDSYSEHYAEWLEEGNEGTEEEWEQTADYEKSVECHLDSMNSRYD